MSRQVLSDFVFRGVPYPMRCMIWPNKMGWQQHPIYTQKTEKMDKKYTKTKWLLVHKCCKQVWETVTSVNKRLHLLPFNFLKVRTHQTAEQQTSKHPHNSVVQRPMLFVRVPSACVVSVVTSMVPSGRFTVVLWKTRGCVNDPLASTIGIISSSAVGYSFNDAVGYGTINCWPRATPPFGTVTENYMSL